MNTAHTFYQNLLDFFKRRLWPETESDAKFQELLCNLDEILQKTEKQKGIYFQYTPSELLLVTQAIPWRGYKKYFVSDAVQEVLNRFLLSAFRDLSVQKNKAAHDTWRQIRDLAKGDPKYCRLVWPRKIIKRRDGSAVIVLHVSNYPEFLKMLEVRPACHGPHHFESGIMLNGLEDYRC